jgi:hypothetical protein
MVVVAPCPREAARFRPSPGARLNFAVSFSISDAAKVKTDSDLDPATTPSAGGTFKYPGARSATILESINMKRQTITDPDEFARFGLRARRRLLTLPRRT